MRTLLVACALFCIATDAAAQTRVDHLWKCKAPASPPRFARSEQDKAVPPACSRWIELRGKGLGRLVALLEGSAKFESANVFLEEAAEALGVAYPENAAGSPATTREVYDRPKSFGIRLTDIDVADAGSLVVMEGLGGVLVETREEGSTVWRKQLLYPSALANYELKVGDMKYLARTPAKAIAIDKL